MIRSVPSSDSFNKINPRWVESPPVGSAHSPQGYEFGKLVFWDQNNDGRFRWIHGDFVTDSKGHRIRPHAPSIRNLLKKIGLRSTRQLHPLWRKAREYGALQDRIHPEKKNQRESAAYRRLVEEKLEDLEDAIFSGDWKEFTREFQEFKILIVPLGLRLTDAAEERLKNKVRFHYHVREAALSLVQGRVDLAAKDLKLARHYGAVLEMDWDPDAIGQLLQAYLPDPIHEAYLKELFRRLGGDPP